MNPIAAQLMADQWAAEPKALQAFLEAVAALDANQLAEAKAALPRGSARDKSFEVIEGAAVIPISGMMMKGDIPWILGFFGIAATSTTFVREQITEATLDPSVEKIVLDIDSPGGSVPGTSALAADVFAARELKSVEVRAQDMMASAALWVGAQADIITAGPTASIGSIGVFTVIEDSSKAFEQAGIEVNVITSHELKGIGVPGAPLTDNQRADVQADINRLKELFVEDVARGRKKDKSEIDELATGQVFIGIEAKKAGLVDAIEEDSSSIADNNADGPDVRGPSSTLTQESTMTPEEKAELEALRKKAAELEAEKEASAKREADANAKAEAARSAQIETIIGANRERIPPAMLDHVRKYAVSCGEDVAAFEAFIAELPVATHSDPDSDDLGDNVPDGDDGDELTAGELAAARKCEISPETYRKYGNVVGALSDGRLILEDGRAVTREEL